MTIKQYFIMVDSVKVIYGYSVGKVSFNELIERVSAVASSYKVDFDLHICKHNLTISLYPFKYRGAKEISETNGAEIMRSLICLCVKFVDDGILLNVEMSTSLPF